MLFPLFIMESKVTLTVEEYTEPVFCCASCHSLAITQPDDALATEFWDGSYCLKCGSTDIVEIPFGEWLEEEERRKRKQREREWNR